MIVPASSHAEAATAVRVDAGDAGEGTGSCGTILVVEDDEALLRVLRKRLEDSGFEVEVASSGAEAIHRIGERPPDLMLLDYRLPDMTGDELVRTLAGERRSVPFIVTTGQGDERVAVSMMKLGARDYLAKDISFFDQLFHAVRLAADQIATEKKLADMEKALRRSEADKSAMSDAISDTILHIRRDGTCVGYVPRSDGPRPLWLEALLGKNVADVMPADQANEHMLRIEQALRTGETQIAQYRMESDGVVRDYEGCFAASGPDEVVAIVRDITEHKQVGNMQREMREHEELTELKTSILSMVSHELRTPLAIIKGYATMLVAYSERFGEGEKRDYLGTIDRATDRLTDLVEHLLDMSRLDAGLLRLDRTPTNIRPLLQMAVAEAAVRAANHRMALTRPVPDVVLHIDGGRIRQVVDNLIDNATKYSPKGSMVTVAAGRRRADFVVSVADQGIGILGKNLPKVFDRMYRIEQKMAEDPSGLGLGLALCKALVEGHGGRIWAESVVGKGSTFYFTIPMESDSGNSHVRRWRDGKC